MNMNESVLITGASSGIGLELARQFAKHHHPLVLVARVQSELQTISAELSREHGVEVQFIAKDLQNPDAPQEIFNAITAYGMSIDILVNNAGLGQRGRFWETPLDRDIAMMRVNAEAVVRMTKLFLPGMIDRRRGRILNTASVAAFEPGPLMAIYHATKAFVLSFSEALATEVEDTGVRVTALCPGATDTDFFAKAHMVDTRVFQKAQVMSPQEVAALGYDALMRGDRVYVPGAMNKTLVFSRRLLSDSAQAKLNKKFYESVDKEDLKRKRGDVESKPHKRF
jgi:short-subunit dehydrogenase